MRILVVEDDSRISSFLRKGLEEAGYIMQLASDGYEARDLITAEQGDLFILDVMLPDIDGLQLAQLIRNNMTGQKHLFLRKQAVYLNTTALKHRYT